MIDVILVDDHSLFRVGEKSVLSGENTDIRVVGEAGSGKALFVLLETTKADIILLDIGLPDISGIEIARRLRKEYPEIKILIFSVENSFKVVQSLINIGIDGFISKLQSSDDDLIVAIHSIMNGLEYFGKDIATIIYNIYVSKKKITEVTSEFTEREREIIYLCRDGLSGRQISEKLNISLRTVNTHKNNIFTKLNINSTMELVQYAMKNGIISLD